MKNSNLIDFANCLEDINKASGINAKRDILEKNKDNIFVRWYCECCYDFYKTMGITTGKIYSSIYNTEFPHMIINETGAIIDFDENQYYHWLVDIREKLYNRSLSGNEARKQVVILCTYVPEYIGKWIANAFNRKTPDGLGAVTVNKIYPDLKPARGVQCCRGELSDINFGDAIEYKIDGLRTYIFYNRNTKEYEVYTRGQRQLSSYNFSFIINKLLYLGILNEDYVVDGEVSAKDWNESVSLAKTKSDLSDEDKMKICFHVFDRIPYSDYFEGTKTEVLSERRKNLVNCFGNNDNYPLKLIHQEILQDDGSNDVISCAKNIARKYINTEYYGHIEGAVVKKLSGYYGEENNNDWIKVKFRETQDFKIVAYTEGLGRLKGKLGAFIIDVNGINVNCGGGYSDEQRKEFWDHRDDYLGCYIEVEYLTDTKDGNIREPVFLRMRDIDKS